MESRRRFDKEFKEGAVRIARETGKPIAQVARRARDQRRHAGQLAASGNFGRSSLRVCDTNSPTAFLAIRSPLRCS